MAPSKIAGQVMLDATTLTDVYICAAGQTVEVALYLCSQGKDTEFRVSIGVNGEDDDPKQYLYYDKPILTSGTFRIDSIWLNAGDILRAYAGDTGVSCNVIVKTVQTLVE